MIKRPVPHQSVVFVCTNVREEGHPKPCCGRRGGTELRARLKSMVEERGLQQVVKVFQSGCLGGCEFGPMLMMFPDRQMAFKVEESDLPGVLDELTRDLPERPEIA